MISSSRRAHTLKALGTSSPAGDTRACAPRVTSPTPPREEAPFCSSDCRGPTDNVCDSGTQPTGTPGPPLNLGVPAHNQSSLAPSRGTQEPQRALEGAHKDTGSCPPHHHQPLRGYKGQGLLLVPQSGDAAGGAMGGHLLVPCAVTTTTPRLEGPPPHPSLLTRLQRQALGAQGHGGLLRRPMRPKPGQRGSGPARPQASSSAGGRVDGSGSRQPEVCARAYISHQLFLPRASRKPGGPGLPLPRLVKPAQRHPRPGRALGPGCHQRLPPATGLNGAPRPSLRPGSGAGGGPVPSNSSGVQLCEAGTPSPPDRQPRDKQA